MRLPRLPNAPKTLSFLWLHRFKVAVLVIAFLILLIQAQWQRIGGLEAYVDARPRVEKTTRKEVDRTIIRGPVETVTKTVIAPDGTKTIEQTCKIAPVEHRNVVRDYSERVETPIQRPLDAPRTRYAGLALSPLSWDRPRVSAGLSIGGRWDLGAFVDTDRRLNDGALGLETRYRF